VPGLRVYKTPGKEKQPPSGRKTFRIGSSARRAAAFLCRGSYTHRALAGDWQEIGRPKIGTPERRELEA